VLQRVFVDADVLASHTAYQWLALLRHETGAFQLHSSAAVVIDAVRVWRRQDPSRRPGPSRRRLDHLVASLDEVIGDLDAAIDLDDDRPVDTDASATRAATIGGAHVLISANADRADAEDLLPVEIYAPDEFLSLVDDTAPLDVRSVTLLQEQRIPPADARPERLTAALAAAGCPAFADRVSSHLRARAS
jgi:hypothetical protein